MGIKCTKSNIPPNMNWWHPELMEGEVLYFEKKIN